MVKFLLIPIEEVIKVNPEASGDFLQEALSLDEAQSIARNWKTQEAFPLTGEYNPAELVAEFNGDTGSQFNSDTYYIYPFDC